MYLFKTEAELQYFVTVAGEVLTNAPDSDKVSLLLNDLQGYFDQHFNGYPFAFMPQEADQSAFNWVLGVCLALRMYVVEV